MRSHIKFFASTKDIFQEAWKETFGEKYKDIVTGRSLSDNQLYRISTMGEMVKNNKLRFITYDISVEHKFRRKTQYYGTAHGTESDKAGRYATQKGYKNFYTKVSDPERPYLGIMVEQKTKREIKKFLDKHAESSARVRIDGLDLNEHLKLQKVIAEIEDLENEQYTSF
jgi:hypothetical protein